MDLFSYSFWENNAGKNLNCTSFYFGRKSSCHLDILAVLLVATLMTMEFMIRLSMKLKNRHPINLCVHCYLKD